MGSRSSKESLRGSVGSGAADPASTEQQVMALVYTRVSIDRHYTMRSTSDQETDCRSWCEQQGWTVGQVIADANRSASQYRRIEREGFIEALELIESGTFDAFVTWEPSRAGREMAAFIQLRAACQCAGVLYLTKGRVYDFARSDDAFMMGLESLTAEKDAAVIRERVLRSSRLRAQKDTPHGRLPYGYRRECDPNTGALVRQVIDEEQAPIIVGAVDDILNGISLTTVTKRLNHTRVPTPMGAKVEHTKGWTNSALRRLLLSPTIAGLRMHQGEVVGEAAWPPVIPVERWEKMRLVLGDVTRRFRVVEPDHQTAPKFLLSHILKCGFCGRPLGQGRCVSPTTSGKPRKRNYYCQMTGCRKASINLEATDAYVTGVLLGWLSTPESLAMLTGGNEDWTEHVTAATAKAEELRHRLDEAAGQYASGAISLSTLASIEKRLNPLIEQAAREAVPPVTDAAVLALVTADDLAAAWEVLELVEKRRLIKTLLDIRIMRAANRGPGYIDTARIKIEPRFITLAATVSPSTAPCEPSLPDPA